MIKELKNNLRYKYSVDCFGYKYYFLNRVDAVTLDAWRSRQMAVRRDIVIDSMPAVYKVCLKRRLTSNDKFAINLLENLMTQVVNRGACERDVDKIINTAYAALVDLNRSLKLKLELPCELVEFKFRSKYSVQKIRF
jgi:hypothetical protein